MRLRFIDRIHPFFWFFVLAVLSIVLGTIFSVGFLLWGGLFIVFVYVLFFAVWFWLNKP